MVRATPPHPPPKAEPATDTINTRELYQLIKVDLGSLCIREELVKKRTEDLAAEAEIAAAELKNVMKREKLLDAKEAAVLAREEAVSERPSKVNDWEVFLQKKELSICKREKDCEERIGKDLNHTLEIAQLHMERDDTRRKNSDLALIVQDQAAKIAKLTKDKVMLEKTVKDLRRQLSRDSTAAATSSTAFDKQIAELKEEITALPALPAETRQPSTAGMAFDIERITKMLEETLEKAKSRPQPEKVDNELGEPFPGPMPTNEQKDIEEYLEEGVRVMRANKQKAKDLMAPRSETVASEDSKPQMPITSYWKRSRDLQEKNARLKRNPHFIPESRAQQGNNEQFRDISRSYDIDEPLYPRRGGMSGGQDTLDFSRWIPPQLISSGIPCAGYSPAGGLRSQDIGKAAFPTHPDSTSRGETKAGPSEPVEPPVVQKSPGEPDSLPYSALLEVNERIRNGSLTAGERASIQEIKRTTDTLIRYGINERKPGVAPKEKEPAEPFFLIEGKTAQAVSVALKKLAVMLKKE